MKVCNPIAEAFRGGHRCGNPVEPSNRRGLMAECRPILGIDRLHAFALKTTLARRYYLSSALLDAPTFARAVRAHWGVENRLHWVMDVVFHDDLARLRTGHGPENMAIVRTHGPEPRATDHANHKP